MAVLKDKKRDYYALKQNLRDEASAPERLDTAGDEMIRELARKQMVKEISLEEQLQMRQEFERGSELKPWTQSGLTTLEKFQTDEEISTEPSASIDVCESEMERIKNRSGLTRRELELGLVEKPGSQSSVLYRFALGNQKPRTESDDLISKLDRHPLNRLKEIEREVFGKKEVVDGEPEMKKSRRKRKRKRVKKRGDSKTEEEPAGGGKDEEEDDDEVEEEVAKERPSLWDVKDMRKFCRNEQQGCQNQKLYTIRGGKIVRINPDDGS